METASLVPIQSLQRIFTPILSQITELLIVTSENYESESGSELINLLRPMVSMSEDIVESLKDLTTVCLQTAAIEYPADAVVKQEAECGSQNLLVAGESLVLCCHILCSATKPDFQLKTPAPHQTDVAGCLSDIYQCMLLLLLSLDDAEVRKIAEYGLSTSDCLASLAAADSLQSLNDQFRSFAVPAANLHISASARCSDMLDEKLQYKLRCALATLRQSLPMLTAALQMAIKYANNGEVLKGRDFCVEQVRKAISDITKIVTTKQGRKSFLPGNEIGLFCEKLNEIKEMLAAENRKKLNMLSLHASAESFVQHSMELSLVLLKSSPSLELKSNAIVGSCRKMMRSLRELEKAEEVLDDNSSLEKQLRGAFDEKCSLLNATAQGAMASVMHAVISLVTNTFKVMDEPMADLIEACVSPALITKDSMNEMNEQKRKERKKVSALSKLFSKHVADITVVTRFSASCCGHVAVYKKYSKVLLSFDQASKTIVTVASELIKGEKPFQTREDGNDLVVNDRIMDLQERWIVILGDVIQLLVASLDLEGLLGSIAEETNKAVEKCIEAIVNMDESQLANHLQRATGKARFLSRVANAIVSCSTEPVYRNGVLSHVKELKHNIVNTVARGNQLIEDIGRAEQQELFTKVASNLLESTKAVSEALLSNGNHPDLTSTNRLNVRDDDSSQTNAVLKEMMVLNKKLISLGFDPLTDEEIETSYPVPSSGEPGWPRYFYKDDQQAQQQDRAHALIPSPNSSQILDCPDDSFPKLTSFPEKIHPVMEHFFQCLAEADSAKSAWNTQFERSKEMVERVCNIVTNIARDTLLESLMSKPNAEDRIPIQKASDRVNTLRDVIFKEADNLFASNFKETELETLLVLASQWSKALYIISLGCARILPLYIVPVRRYLALSLNGHPEDSHSLARYIACYPGSPTKFLLKLASFKEDSQELDKLSIGDFKVHEQNVKELMQLSDALSGLLNTEENEEGEESKITEVVAMCDVIDFDWSTACKTKAEMLTLVNKLSPGNENSLDKAILQLHCLAWSSKVHSLHVNVLKMATLFLEMNGVNIMQSSLYDMVMEANANKSTDVKYYFELILHHMTEHHEFASSLFLDHDALIATWDENLHVTSRVMEEILNHLSSVKSSVPLVYHHGHSMFHFVYLHHLFFMILSYLRLTMTQRKNQHLTARSESRRPPLSARLKSLKEERERRDESLNDLFRGVPKINTEG